MSIEIEQVSVDTTLENKKKAISLISHKAAALIWLNDTAKKRYLLIHKVVIICFGIANSLSGGGMLAIVFSGVASGVIIGISVFIMVLGVLTAALSGLDWNEKANLYAEAARKNTFLHIKCSEILNTGLNTDSNIDEFIKEIIKEEYMIHIESPPIPNRIFKKYNKIFGTSAIQKHILTTTNLKLPETEPEKLPEKKVSDLVSNLLAANREDSILDRMAQLEDTISIISTNDIQNLIKNFNPDNAGPKQKHRRKQTPSELFELSRMV